MPVTPPNTYTEQELVFFLKKKDRAAFNYLYGNYAPSLYTVIHKIIADDLFTEDVLQEAFVKIWINIEMYEAQKCTMFCWMMNVARNLAIDTVKSKQYVNKLKTWPRDAMPQHLSRTGKTNVIGVSGLTGKLPPQHEVILDMVYYKGYSGVEVAKTLDIPLGSVKTHLRKAMIILRKDFSLISGVRKLIPYTEKVN